MYRRIARSVLLVSLAVGIQVSTGTFAAENSGYQIKIIENNQTGCKIKIEFDDFSLSEIKHENQKYSRISTAGFGEVTLPGYPHLPSLSKVVRLPEHAEAELVIRNISSRTLQLQSPVETFAFDDNYEAAEFEGYFPKRTAEISPPVISGGTKFCAVDIFPVRYSREAESIEIIKSIELEITFRPEAGTKLTNQNRKKTREFTGMFGDNLLNPDYSASG